MNRNSELKTENLPKLRMKRSKFDLSHSLITDLNYGRLVPLLVQEILPGDTFDMDIGLVARTKSAFIKPVMDPLFLDIYTFFVPNRIIWEHFKEFMGENSETYWTPKTNYTIPQIKVSETSPINEQDIFNYLGVPIGYTGSFSALAARAYTKIWNEFFRSEATQQPEVEWKDDATETTSSQFLNYGKLPLPVGKMHDYFTNALPEPQRGDAVTIPMTGQAPVKTGTEHITNYTNALQFVDNVGGRASTLMADSSGTLHGTNQTATSANGNYEPSNLWADLSNAAGTINELIEAYAIQKLLWTDGVYGSRYTEILRGHFGVTASDRSLQRPEYLGGKRININTFQVVQNSSTDSTSPQGNITAFGYAEDYDKHVRKSFEEHGIMMTVGCIRFKHSYQQGIQKFLTRKTRYDFYWPELANIGEQPILTKELYATGKSDNDDIVFGYQEAWADYKYGINRVTGGMRSNGINISDDEYHFADYYENRPNLINFINDENGAASLERTLAVSSGAYQAFILNIAFRIEATRPMPAHAVPGFAMWN